MVPSRKADGTWVEWPENARLKEWYGCIEANSYQQGCCTSRCSGNGEFDGW